MKKFVFTLILFATVCVVLGSIKAFDTIEEFNFISKSNPTVQGNSVQPVKYHDCITENDFPDGYLLYTHEITNQDSHWDILKVNESVKKYGHSLDSTVKNLSTVDAHNFIHQAFQKAKNIVAEDSISDIQKHYQGEIMRICYDRDRYLNQNNTITRL
ncbi:hypothetical protein [Flagellimonas crocea]|uniref:hypothetical protein n=1 Tax=Flagellimonas crocea TaxID=3067311 RepID=UPI00296E44CB|nr:hypothetical protein [Muricauda sp. DH64]